MNERKKQKVVMMEQMASDGFLFRGFGSLVAQRSPVFFRVAGPTARPLSARPAHFTCILANTSVIVDPFETSCLHTHIYESISPLPFFNQSSISVAPTDICGAYPLLSLRRL